MSLQLVLDGERRDLLRSAVAGANVAPCADHPCSSEAACAGGGVCRPLGADYACDCPLGRAGVTCERRVDVEAAADDAGHNAGRSPSFGGDGYLRLDAPRIAKK